MSFFCGAVHGQLFTPTHLFSIISCLSFHFNALPYGTQPILTAPYFYTWCSSSLDCPFSIVFLADSYSSFKPTSICQLYCKAFPELFSWCECFLCAYIPWTTSYFFELFEEKPGYHLISHKRYTQLSTKSILTEVNKCKRKIANTRPCIAICYFWLNHGKTSGLRSEALIHSSLYPYSALSTVSSM